MNDTPRADELQDYLSSRIRHACLMPSCSSLQRKMKNNVVQKYKRMLGKYNELTQANEQLEQLKQDYKEQFNELEDKQIELEQANALLDECRSDRDMVIDQLKILATGGTIKPERWASNFRNSMLHDPLTDKLKVRKG